MKDVEHYIKPFNRFEMANGKRGVFLPYEGYNNAVACWFNRDDEGCSFTSNPVGDIGTNVSWRIVKIWKKEGGADITPTFNYDATPIWQEESAQECARRKQIEQLEETIKKAQQQIAELKEVV